MSTTTLIDLLERNARHAESLSGSHFDAVQSEQRPSVVSVCCSDSRVSQEGMWDVDEPGWLFTAGNLGNQVRERVGDGHVVSGDVLYPIRCTDTDVAVVVGHTGCGAVTAALERARSDDPEPLPPGIEARVRSLLPIVESGLADGRTDPTGEAGLVDQLVEYNVDRQVEFLRADGSVPDSTTVLGFVYDFQGVYGESRGRCYLVNRDGETALGALRAAVPERFEDRVRRLLN